MSTFHELRQGNNDRSHATFVGRGKCGGTLQILGLNQQEAEHLRDHPHAAIHLLAPYDMQHAPLSAQRRRPTRKHHHHLCRKIVATWYDTPGYQWCCFQGFEPHSRHCEHPPVKAALVPRCGSRRCELFIGLSFKSTWTQTKKVQTQWKLETSFAQDQA